ncbi:cysteine desulfurase family protein [Pleurocapsa sp. PCC 7327]|uniref:cysteine desulfurase family protein n=1 Tax=Pleurocapsa sp. PCC 7327 TaxID=118163 RepID=UPI00029FBF45|nr:cysteine desulfurase family protein [Pleurocapsa sp. PCC 7327]AFY78395.1 cysteine desulfurase family protein [Pleurocapsa sp. PCC 7327]
MQIYLDYSATTPPRSEVVTKMQEVLAQQWGNPSSLHAWGERAATIIETARIQVANLINAPNPESIVFTSGGTEADNLAMMGVARRYQTPQHIIISSAEHSAIAQPANLLEKWGWQVTRLPVNRYGRVNPLDLKAAIQPNTVLVSIIYGQSEVGTLQPIEELAQIARDCAGRSAKGDRNVFFHTDAVQVAGRVPIDVQKLPVDMLSLSSHKIYGVQGAGALYVREGRELVPLLGGGGQERGLRSGTQAVPVIAAFGVAAELAAADMETETRRLIELRDRLFDRLADCPYLIPTGDRLYRLPHHVSFIVSDPHERVRKEKITGKTLVRQLNLAGIGISSGSACHSGKLSPSPILLAMGFTPEEALGGIRLTLGRETTEAEIDWTAMVLKQVLDRLMPQLVTAGH